MKKRIISIFIAVVMIVSALPMSTVSAVGVFGIVDGDFRDITAAELVAEMGNGWNLGNTLDYHANGRPYDFYASKTVRELETGWVGSSNFTTKELIDSIKSSGFDTIRIPITWYKVSDPNNDWTIREDWLDRVQEIVDWAVDNSLYIIINVHHDNSVIKLQDVSRDGSVYALTRWWEQIGDRFKDYNEKLIFEGLNEPRTVDSKEQWSGGTAEERNNLNILNQAFVDTVRNSGGNNDKRILMVTTIGASSHKTALDGFVLPNDTIENKLALSIHAYEPWDFCNKTSSNVTIFDGGPRSINPINQALDRVKAKSDELNIPVILGEWGSVNKNNPIDRIAHADYYLAKAYSYGMVTCWWDNGNTGTSGDPFGLFRRTTGEVVHPGLLAAILGCEECGFKGDLCICICPKCEELVRQCICCSECGEFGDGCTCCSECKKAIGECICCPECEKAVCICCPECGKIGDDCTCCSECKKAVCICCTVCEKAVCICCPKCGEVGDKCICCPVCKEFGDDCICCPVFGCSNTNCTHYTKGDVDGSGIVNIQDAVQVLCYLAKLDSVLKVGTTNQIFAVAASLITAKSKEDEVPGIQDAVQILCYLAKLPNDI